MLKIQGFAVINGNEQRTLSYTLTEVDDTTGRIMTSNIRKSTPILDADTEILEAMAVIQNIIMAKENN